MSVGYDHNNIFAKILRGEVPCKRIYESEYALCFRDINPQARTHLLLTPKGPFVDVDVFARYATSEQVAGFLQAIPECIAESGLDRCYIKINTLHGPIQRQEVLHFHAHILSIDGKVDDCERDAELVEDSDGFTVRRERCMQRVWIYCKDRGGFGGLKNDVLTIVPKVVRRFGATAGFNLHLFEGDGSVHWRLDW